MTKSMNVPFLASIKHAYYLARFFVGMCRASVSCYDGLTNSPLAQLMNRVAHFNSLIARFDSFIFGFYSFIDFHPPTTSSICDLALFYQFYSLYQLLPSDVIALGGLCNCHNKFTAKLVRFIQHDFARLIYACLLHARLTRIRYHNSTYLSLCHPLNPFYMSDYRFNRSLLLSAPVHSLI